MSQVAALSALIEGVNELAMLRNAAEYSPPRRGGVDAPSIKWIRSEIGAAGVVSSAKLFRPKHFAELTTPSAASSVASRLLLMPQPSPPLRGGEYPELNFSPIRSHLHRPPLQRNQDCRRGL